ncbi:MAG: hypothetical protein IKJ07_07705 [Clostridia bacterium]|nr:hypothetical protein [Clostridia bacterium]
MAIKYTSTKIKKEKPVKIKQEKAAKVKQEKSVKIKQDSFVKIKKEKPVKIKRAKLTKDKQETPVKIKKDNSIKIKQDKSVKISKGSVLQTSPKLDKEKPSVSIDGMNEKKAKKAKVFIVVAAIVLVLALVAVGISLYVKYANEIEADGKNIASVYVSAYPTNVTYYIGDTKPDYSGLKIGVMLKNGTNHYIEYSKETAQEFTFRGFDCSAYSEGQTITVTYKGYDCEFKISVIERPQETPILEKISLETLPKTEYKVGEWLSTTGGVILLEYTNHAPLRVNLMNKDVYGWEEAYEAGPGTYTLKVMYVENGVLKETTYEITISE